VAVYQFVANSHEKTRHIARGLSRNPESTLCGLRNIDRSYGMKFEYHSGICMPCVRAFACIAGNGWSVSAVDYLANWLMGGKDTLEVPVMSDPRDSPGNLSSPPGER
jgi:hypothetical protein